MKQKEIKFGLVAPLPGASIDGLLKFAKRAERLGFDSVWFADHIVFVAKAEAPEAWTIIAALGRETKRVSMGTVSDPHRMHPAVFAQRLATVDQLSGGRAVLTLGVGESMNLDPFGIKWNRALARLRESVGVMRTLWEAEGPVDFQGEFYNLSKAFLQVKPFNRKRVPVYIASHGPKGLRLTGEIGDGWMPTDLNPKLYGEYLKIIEEGARGAGRAMDEIEPCLWVFTSVAKKGDEAYKALEPFRYVLMVPEQVEKAGYNVHLPEEYRSLSYFNILPTDEEKRQKLREMGSYFPREVVLDFTICGPKDDCIKKIEEFVESGVRHFALFYGFSPDKDYALRTYVKQIIPYFKG